MKNPLLLLMKERYGKVVAALCLLILLSLAFLGYSTTRDWHTNYTYFNSAEFVADFQENPEAYSDWDEDGNPIPYQDMQDYTEKYYYLFTKSDWDAVNLYEKNYEPDSLYERNGYGGYLGYSMLFSIPMIFIFLLFGFAAFFVDLKTAFNNLLFASGFSRKKIFASKLLVIGVPLLATYLLGSLIRLSIIYLQIPREYINTPLWVLLSNILSTTFLAACLFAAGCFIGILVGNLIFGPLTLLVFGLITTGIPRTLTNLATPLLGRSDHYSVYFQQFFVSGFGKNAGHWQAWLFFTILTTVILQLSCKAYEQISLETNGDYLLLPKWRRPIFLLMSGYTSLILFCGLGSPLESYYYLYRSDKDTSLMPYLLQQLLLLLTVLAICGSLVYFSALKKKFLAWQEKRGGKVY